MARKGLWPTPTVGDSKNARNSTAQRNKIPPTGIHAGDTLVDAITKKIWPTPTARDWRDGSASQKTMEKNARPLNEVVCSGVTKSRQRWATPTASAAKGSSAPDTCNKGKRDLREDVKGQLNPAWVGWLMNWPRGWASLEPLSVEYFVEWKEKTGRGEWWNQDPAEIIQGQSVIHRTTTDLKHRVARLRALGNGQVPVVVVLAWKILTEGLRKEI